MQTVTSRTEFVQKWAGVQNFAMAGDCVPFAYDFPPVETIVDILRQDEKTEVRNGLPGKVLDVTSTVDGFRNQPLADALTRPFGLANYSLSRFYGKGGLLEGFEEQVMVPWRQFLADSGFTFHRCYPIIFISGPGCATNYHVDKSHVVAWQIAGCKRFCGLRDPNRWFPVETVAEEGIPKSLQQPEALTAADILACDMQPGDVLWNALLTPHWVLAGDTIAMSVNLSMGGLRHRGRLCRNGDCLHAWYAKHPESWF